MALDLSELVAVSHTAIVTQECQEGVIGARSSLPDLAAAGEAVGMVGNGARLGAAARSASLRLQKTWFSLFDLFLCK